VGDQSHAAVRLHQEHALHPSGIVVAAGRVVQIVAIADECLEPWKDTGISEQEVRELYEPRITTKETTS
jgi:hypothetical protein